MGLETSWFNLTQPNVWNVSFWQKKKLILVFTRTSHILTCSKGSPCLRTTSMSAHCICNANNHKHQIDSSQCTTWHSVLCYAMCAEVSWEGGWEAATSSHQQRSWHPFSLASSQGCSLGHYCLAGGRTCIVFATANPPFLLLIPSSNPANTNTSFKNTNTYTNTNTKTSAEKLPPTSCQKN